MHKALKIYNCAIVQKMVSKICMGVDYNIKNMQDFFQIFVNFERKAVLIDWTSVQYLIHANI